MEGSCGVRALSDGPLLAQSWVLARGPREVSRLRGRFAEHISGWACWACVCAATCTPPDAVQSTCTQTSENSRHEITFFEKSIGPGYATDAYMTLCTFHLLQAEPSPSPAHLGRADPSELLLDKDEDADEPRPKVKVPDDGMLSAYLPAEALAAAAVTAAAVGRGRRAAAAAAEAAGSGRGGADGSESQQQQQQQGHVLPRQQALAALELEKQAALDGGVREVMARTEAFNRLVEKPHRAAVKL